MHSKSHYVNDVLTLTSREAGKSLSEEFFQRSLEDVCLQTQYVTCTDVTMREQRWSQQFVLGCWLQTWGEQMLTYVLLI